jgi:hypothetical protein
MSVLLGLDVGTGGRPAHGAALLSGVAAGVYRDVDEACSRYGCARR